jgi:hypothetical protein
MTYNVSLVRISNSREWRNRIMQYQLENNWSMCQDFAWNPPFKLSGDGTNVLSKGQEVSSDVEDKELLDSGLEEMHKTSSSIPCVYICMYMWVMFSIK